MAYYTAESAKRNVVRIRFGTPRMTGKPPMSQTITVNVGAYYSDFRQLTASNLIVSTIQSQQCCETHYSWAEHPEAGWMSQRIDLSSYNPSTGIAYLVHSTIAGSGDPTHRCWADMTCDLCIVP